MADFQITGYFDTVFHTKTAVYVIVQENRDGYLKSNGEMTKECLYVYRIAFKPYFKSFIKEHFKRGSLVTIKGEVLPYTSTHNGSKMYGVSFIGQTINLASMPKNRISDVRLARESQNGTKQGAETPDYEAFYQDDFDFSTT